MCALSRSTSFRSTLSFIHNVSCDVPDYRCTSVLLLVASYDTHACVSCDMIRAVAFCCIFYSVYYILRMIRVVAFCCIFYCFAFFVFVRACFFFFFLAFFFFYRGRASSSSPSHMWHQLKIKPSRSFVCRKDDALSVIEGLRSKGMEVMDLSSNELAKVWKLRDGLCV